MRDALYPPLKLDTAPVAWGDTSLTRGMDGRHYDHVAVTPTEFDALIAAKGPPVHIRARTATIVRASWEMGK